MDWIPAEEAAIRLRAFDVTLVYGLLREQLLYLIKISDAESIGLQVIPATLNRGVRGPFTIATLEGGKEVAFSEGAFGGTVSTRPEDIATVVASWEPIRDEALPMSMSRDLIAQIAEEWEA